MKLKRDLHLEVSRKLQNTVRVKVFAYRSGRQEVQPERVCLGTLHMPEEYFALVRTVIETGTRMIGARTTVGGSYFERKAATA